MRRRAVAACAVDFGRSMRDRFGFEVRRRRHPTSGCKEHACGATYRGPMINDADGLD
jgi:hypothetical protein